MNIKKILCTATVTAALVITPAVSAQATEPEPAYVLAAWNINTPDFQTGGDVWGGGGQTIAHTLPTDSTDLTAIQPLLVCGGWYQIDLYNNDDITESLIAGGVLYGPDNPDESPANGVNPWYITSYYSGDCAPEPEDKLFSDQGETFTCEFWTYWTKTGYYAKSFDPVANVWTYADEPTITDETSENFPTNYDERQARGCEPELAETGSETPLWGGILATTLILMGIALPLFAAWRPLRTPRHRA